MKKKIIGIAVCMLMFASALSVAAPVNKKVTEAAPITTPFAGNTVNPSVTPLSKISTLIGKTVYGCNCFWNNKTLVSFNLDNPGTINYITNVTSANFLSGGCWVNGAWWGCEHFGNSKIWKINPTTGEMTLVGSSGVYLDGIAYDDTTGTMYGCSANSLYTINMFTGNATLVGSCGSRTFIGIACDSTGHLYGEDIANDRLYSINKTNGHTTLIGPFGMDLNYAQDMAFDKDEDKLYLAALTVNGTVGEGALYYCDHLTGACTKIGVFGNATIYPLIEISAFTIPYTSDVEIGDLKGGINIHTTIKNTGKVNFSNVKWSIVLEKGVIFLGKKTDGTITSLSIGQSVDIKTGLILGFGKTLIMVKIETPDHFIVKTATSIIFLFLSFGVK